MNNIFIVVEVATPTVRFIWILYINIFWPLILDNRWCLSCSIRFFMINPYIFPTFELKLVRWEARTRRWHTRERWEAAWLTTRNVRHLVLLQENELIEDSRIPSYERATTSFRYGIAVYLQRQRPPPAYQTNCISRNDDRQRYYISLFIRNVLSRRTRQRRRGLVLSRLNKTKCLVKMSWQVGTLNKTPVYRGRFDTTYAESLTTRLIIISDSAGYKLCLGLARITGSDKSNISSFDNWYRCRDDSGMRHPPWWTKNWRFIRTGLIQYENTMLLCTRV
jgi:hypothetical protein